MYLYIRFLLDALVGGGAAQQQLNEKWMCLQNVIFRKVFGVGCSFREKGRGSP